MSDSAENRVQQVEIPLKLDLSMALRHVKFHGSTERLKKMADELGETVRSIARPKGVYLVSRVQCTDRDTVNIDGVSFTSRVLNKNLCDFDEVYPFIVTIGKELEALNAPARDLWRQFCLDAIKTVVLISSVDYLTELIKEKFNLADAAHMNPGEIKDWPITEQKPLFSLFGGAEKKIGVSLTSGGVIKPIKSRSGILFPNDTDFVSCLLCTQEKCPGRRAAYDADLMEEYMK